MSEPTKGERIEILKLKISETPNNLKEDQIIMLANSTNNYACADIDSLFKAALSKAID